jgi:hypothetical protein
MYKILFFLFTLAFSPALYGQVSYSYTDPCTGVLKTISVPSNGVTVTYYGQVQTFQPADFYSGVFESWAQGVYGSFGNNNPCASVVGLPTGITIAQSTTLNFLSIINSLDAVKDMAGGSTNILSGVNSAGKVEKKEGKKENKNGNSNSSSNNNSNQQSSTSNNQSQNQTSGSGSSQGQMNSSSSQSGQASRGSNQGSTTGNSSSGSANGNQGSGSNSGSSNGNQGAGSANGNQGSSSNGSGEASSSGTSGGSGSENGNQGSGSSSSGSNAINGSGSGSGNSNGTPTTEEPKGAEGGGKTNIVGSSVNNAQTASNKNGNRPNVVASSDFVGFNFKNTDVTYGGKFTGGYTSARWDGARSHGILVDYTTALKGPNISGFYAFIRKKRIDLISTSLTLGFDTKPTVYGTLALGQMWDLDKKKKAKALYMVTASVGSVYGEAFVGTAAIAGAMYDLRIVNRFDIKLMGLYVYAPYVSYYNDILLKSPHVVLPIIGTNIKITKKFKLNINGGGAWAIKENALNYTVMMGTRFLL